MNLSGRHALKVTGADGKPRTVIIPAGKHDVVNGQVVPR